MSVFMFVVVAVLSFVVGVIGFSQIIGAVQNLSVRPNLLLPMILWAAILAGGFFLERHLFPDDLLPLLIGYGASFVIVLFQGRIE